MDDFELVLLMVSYYTYSVPVIGDTSFIDFHTVLCCKN